MQLMLFQQGFPASRSPLRETEKGKKTTVTCGRKLSQLYGEFSPLPSFSKMLLESYLFASNKYSMIWKEKALGRKHFLFQLLVSGRFTNENVSGLLDSETAFQFLPTPLSQEWKGTSRSRFNGSPKSKGIRTVERLRLSEEEPQYLNPSFALELMGYPSNYLEIS